MSNQVPADAVRPETQALFQNWHKECVITIYSKGIINITEIKFNNNIKKTIPLNSMKH